MKRTILMIMTAMMLLPCAHAQEIIEFSFWVENAEDIRVESIRVVPGTEDQVEIFEHAFSIELVDEEPLYSSYFAVPDKRLTNPPSPAYEVLVTRKLPYLGNKGEIMIFKLNELLFSFDLSQLCVENKVCDDYENYITCPEDCELSHSDYVCVAEEDGVCDPDCDTGADIDCLMKEGEAEVKKEAEERIRYLYIIYGAAALIAVMVVLYLKARKKGKRRK